LSGSQPRCARRPSRSGAASDRPQERFIQACAPKPSFFLATLIAPPDFDVSEPGWLLESTYVLRDTHTFFVRAEKVKNSELFDKGQPLHHQAFSIGKLSVGYIYDFAKTGPVKWGIGGSVGFLEAPSQLDPYYGSSPRSYRVFLQGTL